jgi:multiple antibiotic resistance protein
MSTFNPSIVALAIILFFTMNGFNNLQHYRALLTDSTIPGASRRNIGRTLLCSLILLIFLYLVGPHLLGLLHIGNTHLLLASGTILLLISIKTIFPSLSYIQEKFEPEELPEERRWLYPLTLPLFIGPAAIPLFFLLAMDYFSLSLEQELIAIVIAWTLSALLILLHRQIIALLGEKLLSALQRLCGLILLIIGIELLSVAIKVLSTTPQ